MDGDFGSFKESGPPSSCQRASVVTVTADRKRAGITDHKRERPPEGGRSENTVLWRDKVKDSTPKSRLPISAGLAWRRARGLMTWVDLVEDARI